MGDEEFAIDEERLKAVLYQSDGGYTEIGTLFYRAFSSVADILIASEESIDVLLEQYDLQFSLGVEFIPMFTFSPSIDRHRLPSILRENDYPVPSFLEDFIENTLTVVSPSTDFAGYYVGSSDRFSVYDVGDDTNLRRGDVEEPPMEKPTNKILIPFDYVLQHWEFSGFESGERIRQLLSEALSEDESDPIRRDKLGVTYNSTKASEATEMMNRANKVVVTNLFSDDTWRKHAFAYGVTLFNEAYRELERRKSEIDSEAVAPFLSLLRRYGEILSEKYPSFTFTP